MGKRNIKNAEVDFSEAIRRDPKGTNELLTLGLGGNLHLPTAYGTYWELLEGKAGSEMQAATIGNLSFYLLSVLNGPEDTRRAFLEGILEHASKSLSIGQQCGKNGDECLTIDPWLDDWSRAIGIGAATVIFFVVGYLILENGTNLHGGHYVLLFGCFALAGAFTRGVAWIRKELARREST